MSVSTPAASLPFQIILVDEYQDTNLLQEQIFFSWLKSLAQRLLWSATTTKVSTVSAGPRWIFSETFHSDILLLSEHVPTGSFFAKTIGLRPPLFSLSISMNHWTVVFSQCVPRPPRCSPPALLFSHFRGRVLTDPTNSVLTTKSILHLLRYFQLPIAEDTVSIDESLIENLPHDHLNVLSIHQSKGLEFSLVIVDEGSDLQQARRSNAFRRFPAGPSAPHLLEDLLRPHSPLGTATRDGTDRAFDDLCRQYFVAFSTPDPASRVHHIPHNNSVVGSSSRCLKRPGCLSKPRPHHRSHIPTTHFRNSSITSNSFNNTSRHPILTLLS